MKVNVFGSISENLNFQTFKE